MKVMQHRQRYQGKIGNDPNDTCMNGTFVMCLSNNLITRYIHIARLNCDTILITG